MKLEQARAFAKSHHRGVLAQAGQHPVLVRGELMERAGFLIGTAACLLAACGNDYEDGRVGPCVVYFGEPIVTIQSVTSQPSGASIESIELSSLTIDGRPLEFQDTTGTSQPEYGFNIRIEDGTVWCDVPCGFGNEPGTYEFLAGADGHESETISVQADYASREGPGCPVTYDDGADLEFDLTAT